MWGVIVTIRRLIAWWHIPGTGVLEREAAANGLLNDHLRIHKAAKETRKARGTILALCLAVLAAAVVAMVVFAPGWAWALAAVILFVLFALAGRPQGKTITTKAELPAQVQPPTQDVITRALGSIGVAEINKVLRDGGAIGFPSPVREDGPGWRAEVDLPYGVTAAQVIDRRPQLASGLRRPLGAVWPEPVTGEHAGRLELWVGRADISKARPPTWPLLRSGQADVFGELPFGTDVRGRGAKVPMAYHNWLIGSIPRQGKTASVRVLTCGAALDPLAELWLHELKGSGDLDPLESCSHRFVSGIHDEAIGYAAESLKLLRAEVGRRTERIKALDRARRRISKASGRLSSAPRSTPASATRWGPRRRPWWSGPTTWTWRRRRRSPCVPGRRASTPGRYPAWRSARTTRHRSVTFWPTSPRSSPGPAECTGKRSPTGSPSGSPNGEPRRPATACGPSSAPAASPPWSS